MRISGRRTTRSAAVSFTLDTNVLVYTVDSTAGERHLRSLEIVDRAIDVECKLMLQTLSEFYSVVTRKRVMSAVDVAAQVNDWLLSFPCVAASPSAIRAALSDACAGRKSYWDALLVATAAEAGCRVVLTEDMADGA